MPSGPDSTEKKLWNQGDLGYGCQAWVPTWIKARGI